MASALAKSRAFLAAVRSAINLSTSASEMVEAWTFSASSPWALAHSRAWAIFQGSAHLGFGLLRLRVYCFIFSLWKLGHLQARFEIAQTFHRVCRLLQTVKREIQLLAVRHREKQVTEGRRLVAFEQQVAQG